jgi:Tol biopolymer transport system component
VIFEYNTGSAALTTVYTNGIYALPWSDDFYGPEMTPDGRFLAFTSGEQGTNIYGSIRLWDSQTGTNALVSTNGSGVYSANTLAQAASVTPDGSRPVFVDVLQAGDKKTLAPVGGRLSIEFGASFVTVQVQVAGKTVPGWRFTPTVAPFSLSFASSPGS